ncbi:MAG: allophanate hydrolase subunit 1 [Sphingomonadaceae bacterium]
MSRPPLLRPVGEAAVLADFGGEGSSRTSARVLALDEAVAQHPPAGLVEAVPAATSLLLRFDPLVTDHAAILAHLRGLAARPRPASPGRLHRLPVTYEGAPDLAAAAEALGLAEETLIARHVGRCYRVVMCGFAPGCAYLGDLHPSLRLPRKPQVVRNVPAGSVIIAGRQCIVTTLTLPTGWWAIGHCPVPIFDPDAEHPFLLAPGDRVRFARLLP